MLEAVMEVIASDLKSLTSNFFSLKPFAPASNLQPHTSNHLPRSPSTFSLKHQSSNFPYSTKRSG
jgi:hypothetical protein